MVYADIKVEGIATVSSSFASARNLGKIQFTESAYSNPGRYPIITLEEGASVSGKRYNVDMNGIIYTKSGGPEFFPGTIDGTVSNGGQYA